MNQKLTFASEAEYDEAIRKAQVEAEKADSELKVTRYEYDNDSEIEKLSQELENLKKPYEEKIDRQNEKLGELRRNLSTLQAERKDFIESMKVRQAQQKGEMDAESVTAFLNLYKIKGYGSTIKLKKELSNGIKAFQEKPEEKFHQWNKLFLFKGTDLVGFWSKRGSEHPGDDVYSQAWIGVKTLAVDEDFSYKTGETGKKGNDIVELEFARLKDYYKAKENSDVVEKHVFYRMREHSYNKRTDPTMQQFLDYSENFKGDLVAIDVTDEKTRDILHTEPS